MSSILAPAIAALWIGVSVPTGAAEPGHRNGEGPGPQEPVACEIVDQASAEAVLGSGVTQIGGAPGGCRYDDAERRLILIVQILDAVLYDAAPVNPQTPTDVGDRGRSGVGSSGTAHVQFAKGRYSVTLRLTPMQGPPADDLLDPLIDIARVAADRMPG